VARRHRRDDDGLWSEQSAEPVCATCGGARWVDVTDPIGLGQTMVCPDCVTRVAPASPTLEPVERALIPGGGSEEPVFLDEHWRLRTVAFVVYYLPEPVVDLFVKAISLCRGIWLAIGDWYRGEG
jgi:hypothetical protein